MSAEIPLKRHFLQLNTGESGKMVAEGDCHSLNKGNFIFWNVHLVAWGGQLNKKMTIYNYRHIYNKKNNKNTKKDNEKYYLSTKKTVKWQKDTKKTKK